MSTHIGAQPGDIAQTVLLPGDPLRAEWAAETFLENIHCISRVRGMLGYTGTWNGHPVTIHGTGMGMPSLSIYANELIREYGVRTLIRIGSCGAMQPHLELRDVIVAMAATAISTPSSITLREINLAPNADWILLRNAVSAAERLGTRISVGNVYSSDSFYHDRSDLTLILQNHGVLAVEMEAAELYTLAMRHGIRALAILTVSDHLMTGSELPAEDRERSFADMVKIALEAAFTE